MSDRVHRITAGLTSGTTVRISNGRHEWGADEPPDAGGEDTGPTPYELLVGALAACTCVTLALYCRQKGWALRSVSAEFSFDKIHAEDCAECEDPGSGFIDTITSVIHIEGDFDEAAKERLKAVALRCPVHKTLDHGVTFRSETVTVT